MVEQLQEKGQLSIHTENIFPIIKKWLYSEHDIFTRELISNAIDALQKRKTVDKKVKEEDLRVEIKINKKKQALEFIDYGIGMTRKEIDKFINQIAFSGAEEFIEKYKDKQTNIIGHFGLGFYSSFMVADKVTIDSLSWQKNAKPAYWECDGTTSYSLGEGSRKEVGTTVTVYLNKESREYLDFSKLRELIEKYSNFVPFPIELEKKVLNQKEALWNRKPKDVKDEEYKEFYKSVFHDFQDPLFWIHLNVDYPFVLKGILYFPKITNQLELQRGKVKLYCNNVFVADNLQEFIPEFLLLLRGGIDIPDIPLNVSRSFLQQDQNVKKISKYIIKKVSDFLNDLFKADRKKFEQYWEDIHQFIKFGAITEESFYEGVKELIIYKSISGNYTTVDEYLENNKTDKKPQKIYYTAGENTQVTYLNMMKDAGKDVLIAEDVIDTHLFQHLEMKNKDISFVRIDSELNEDFVEKDKKELLDSDNKTELDKIKEIFVKAIDDKDVQIDVKRLKNKNVPGLVVFNEFMRRMQDMNNIISRNEHNLLKMHEFIVNAENPTVKKILKLHATGKDKEVKLLCNYLHNLSLIEQRQFTGKDLSAFIETTYQILDLV
ncbi:MAG: molecular chaperone HtpG [Candidatus Cloacimonetes bacterium]|nr:molecular chaperone HtpG [Candidatus Cloacimonadota bacterium]